MSYSLALGRVPGNLLAYELAATRFATYFRVLCSVPLLRANYIKMMVGLSTLKCTTPV